jgi:hypothetical protein
MFQLDILQHQTKKASGKPRKRSMVLAHFSPKELEDMDHVQGGVVKDEHGIKQYKNLWDHLLHHPVIQENFKAHARETKASGGSADIMQRLRRHGRHGDSEIASIPSAMADMLDSVYGKSRNPQDGKHEYFSASSIGDFLKGAIANVPFEGMKDFGKHAAKTGSKAFNYMMRPGAIRVDPGVPAAPAAPAAPLGMLAQMGRAAGSSTGKALGSLIGGGLLTYGGGKLGQHIGNKYGGKYGDIGGALGAAAGMGAGAWAGKELGAKVGGHYGSKIGGNVGERMGSMAGAAPAAVGRAARAGAQAVSNLPGHVAESASTAYRGLPEPVRNIAGGIAAEVPRMGSAALDVLNAPANAFAALHGPALSQDEYTYRMFPQLRPQPQRHPIIDDVE